MTTKTIFNYNTFQIMRTMKLFGVFPDNTGYFEQMRASVPLYNNINSRVGNLTTNGDITNTGDNNLFYINIHSTIFINNIGTITYNYSATSSTKYLQTSPGTKLVCNIVSSTGEFTNNNGILVINFFENGDANLVITF